MIRGLISEDDDKWRSEDYCRQEKTMRTENKKRPRRQEDERRL